MPKLINAGQSPFGWHRYQSFMQCPQKYAYSYIINPKREPSLPLALGSLVHVGLAHHYKIIQHRQLGTEHDLYSPLEAISEVVRFENQDVFREAEAKAYRIINFYQEKHCDEEEKWDILGVEDVITLWCGKAPMTMRADLLFRSRKTGKIHFMDHKTTSRFTKSHPKFYAMSGQFVAYRIAGQNFYGDQWGSLVLNVIEHKALKKPPYFRVFRPVLPDVTPIMGKFSASIEEVWNQMRKAHRSGKPPHTWTVRPTEFTCFHRYGACDHYDRCQLGLKK